MSSSNGFFLVGSAAEIEKLGLKVVQVGHAPVLVLFHEGSFHALDNRCPHMGFPLSKGDVHITALMCG